MYRKKPNILNFDLNEINKFSSMANQWWNHHAEFKFLHKMNALRLKYIEEKSDGLYKKKILDIGCGGGILTETMAKKGAYVTGIDISDKILMIAKKHARKNKLNIKYIRTTVEEHALFIKNYYDIITCMETLEHIPNPSSIVETCSNLIKSSGDVFFSTLNRSKKSYLMAIFFAEYILRIIPCGTHDFKKFIRPSELLNWIDQTTLYEKNISGMKYNVFTKNFELSSDISINYILHTKSIK